MVQVAVTGLGAMGKTHLSIYSRLNNVKVAAICDSSADALSITTLNTAGNIQVAVGDIDFSALRKYADFDKMLADGGFDVVDICLPTNEHVDHAVKAMEAGYHVFCEKPMALTLAEAEIIKRTSEKTGKLFMVGMCLRYWPAYTEIKKLLDDQRYGSVKYAEFARFSPLPVWGWNNWLLDEKRSGNAALELHVHDTDMVYYLFGFPKKLRSVGVFDKDGSVPHIATVYQYDHFAVSSVGGWLCANSFKMNMRAFFVLEKATIEMDYSKQPIVMVYPQDGEKYALPLPDVDAYAAEVEDFILSVERGKLSGIVTPESALDSLRLCLEEIRSAKENHEIEVS